MSLQCVNLRQKKVQILLIFVLVPKHLEHCVRQASSLRRPCVWVTRMLLLAWCMQFAHVLRQKHHSCCCNTFEDHGFPLYRNTWHCTQTIRALLYPGTQIYQLFTMETKEDRFHSKVSSLFQVIPSVFPNFDPFCFNSWWILVQFIVQNECRIRRSLFVCFGSPWACTFFTNRMLAAVAAIWIGKRQKFSLAKAP